MIYISLLLSPGIPYLLLYSRKNKWNSIVFQQSLFFISLVVGIIGFILSNTNEYRLLFYSFLSIPIYLILDTIFKTWSFKKHNRDLNLWLNYSNDVQGIFAPMSKHRNFKTTDIVFSILLLLLVFGLAFIGAILFGKTDFYNQLF